MPSIHFRKTVDAPPEDVYAALATQEGLAGNWTDQLEVPEETGAVARFGFGPDWAKTLELRIDALEPGRRVEWTPVGGFPGLDRHLDRLGARAGRRRRHRRALHATAAGRSRRPTARWRCAATRGR